MIKTYVLAGASDRGLSMFSRPICEELSEYARLMGVYDINIHRSRIVSRECGGVPVYADFDEMLSEVKPDAVIVATVDAYHHVYIIKALEAGCDVISEKPLTIDADKCREIILAEEKSGKNVQVTFNCRFIPFMVKIKELLNQGALGMPWSVDFTWMLDRNMDFGAHGTSYFRRWNRYMDKSGGLLVHKSSHHLDLVNWWLGKEPVEVFARGIRKLYGNTRKEKGQRCMTCNYKETCEFYIDISAKPFEMEFYVEAEAYDGYIKDGCVFAEDIDIFDSMYLNVKYEDDIYMNYSLIATSPYEGWNITINGSKGRLEAEVFSTGSKAGGNHDVICVYDLNGGLAAYEVGTATGTHGGGDKRLRDMLFKGVKHDLLGQKAGLREGVMSVMIGVAANRSIELKRPVDIASLLAGKE